MRLSHASFRLRSVAGLICALSMSGTATAQAVSANDQLAWEAINTKIIEKVQGIDKTLLERYAIQLATTPMFAIWDQGSDGYWELLEIADFVPNWGPTFVKSSSRFSDEYLKFVSSVAIKGRPDVTPAELNAKRKSWDDLSLRTSKKYKLVLQEWTKYLKETKASGQSGFPFDIWAKNVSEYAPDYISLKGQRDSAYSAYYNLLSPEEQSLGVFKQRMTSFMFAPEDIVKGDSRYPYNYGTESLKALKTAGEEQFNKKQPIFSFDSQRDKVTKLEKSESWSAGASYGRFFGAFRIGGNASGTKYNLDKDTQSSNLSYNAYGLAYIPIDPRGWYAGALVKHFDGNGGNFLPGSVVSNATLWGKNGSLRLRPVGVVVAYKPTLTAVMSQDQLNIARETLEAGGSVGWGPFSFGGRYSKSHEKVEEDKQKGTISVISESPFPYVLAVISERLNYGGK